MNRESYAAVARCSTETGRNPSPNFSVSNNISKRYEIRPIVTFSKKFESFDSIANALRTVCPHLKGESNPLLALMTCRGRRFFFPVFYALVRLFEGINSCCLASRIWKNVFEKHCNDDGFARIFLKNLETRVDSKLVDYLSEKFTFDTIVYCGMNGGPFLEWEIHDTIDHTYEDKVEARLLFWWERVKEDVLQCYTDQEILQIVQWIVKICFPIVNTTKGRVFIWDPFDEKWCLVSHLEDTLQIILDSIWDSMKQFTMKELDTIGFEIENNLCWLELTPNWSLSVKDLIQQVNESCFKIHEDDSPVRQLKHNKILNELSILHESANVPELYILEEQSMKWNCLGFI